MLLITKNQKSKKISILKIITRSYLANETQRENYTYIYTHKFSNSTVGFDAIIITSFHLALFYTDKIITI